MKAMILAAGRGERLRPLTDTTPKPLLKVGEKCLIEYHLDNLAAAGITDVIINISWLRELIRETIGKGEKYNLTITYSDEGDEALETAGGIIKAIPLLGDDPFLVVNGDIWTDFDFSKLLNQPRKAQAHLVLVNNPEHNAAGDFALRGEYLRNNGNTMYTFSGIGIYSKQLFEGLNQGVSALAPILREKSKFDLVTAETYDGEWTDIGTAERMETLNNKITTSQEIK